MCILKGFARDTVWKGTASSTLANPVSGKFRQIVDFSELTEVGEYTLCVNKTVNQKSQISNHKSQISNHKFQISNHPYRELTRKALRAFYYQRASMDIVEPYAEGFARKAGHPDDHVIVHASAATDERPEGTVISSPGGWYDAGDYNKYIVNSGFTMGVWLMASFFGNLLAGWLASFYESWSLTTLFSVPAIGSLAFGVIMWLMTKKIKQWMHGVH